MVIQNELVNILYIKPNDMPSVELLSKPFKILHRRGLINCIEKYELEVTQIDVVNTNLIVICRSSSIAYRPVYEYIFRNKIPIIYQLDDYLLELPSDIHLTSTYEEKFQSEYLFWFLKNVDCVQVYNKLLSAIIIQNVNSNVEIGLPYMDWDLIPAELPILDHSCLNIVYPTSRLFNDPFWPIFLQDIISILEKYKNTVRFHVWDYCPLELKPYSNVIIHPFELSYEKFFREFSRSGYAIGLAPILNNHIFYKCKTDNKFREFAASGVVGIYSDSEVYSSVKDRYSGFLVSENQSWFEILDYLIRNPKELEPIRENAYQVVLNKYSSDNILQETFRLISENSRILEKEIISSSIASINFPKKTILSTIRPVLRKIYYLLTPGFIKKKIFDIRTSETDQKSLTNLLSEFNFLVMYFSNLNSQEKLFPFQQRKLNIIHFSELRYVSLLKHNILILIISNLDDNLIRYIRLFHKFKKYVILYFEDVIKFKDQEINAFFLQKGIMAQFIRHGNILIFKTSKLTDQIIQHIQYEHIYILDDLWHQQKDQLGQLPIEISYIESILKERQVAIWQKQRSGINMIKSILYWLQLYIEIKRRKR